MLSDVDVTRMEPYGILLRGEGMLVQRLMSDALPDLREMLDAHRFIKFDGGAISGLVVYEGHQGRIESAGHDVRGNGEAHGLAWHHDNTIDAMMLHCPPGQELLNFEYTGLGDPADIAQGISDVVGSLGVSAAVRAMGFLVGDYNNRLPLIPRGSKLWVCERYAPEVENMDILHRNAFFEYAHLAFFPEGTASDPMGTALAQRTSQIAHMEDWRPGVSLLWRDLDLVHGRFMKEPGPVKGRIERYWFKI